MEKAKEEEEEEEKAGFSRVDELPGVGQVGGYLHGDQHLLLDVNGTDHLMEELARVQQELPDLEVALELVELLHLQRGGKEEGTGGGGDSEESWELNVSSRCVVCVCYAGCQETAEF